MENSTLQPKENNQVAVTDGKITTHNPGIYRMAPEDKKVLTEDQSAALIRPFDDLEIEIRPDGIIYIPAALIRMRFIETLGPSNFSILLFRDWEEEFRPGVFKRYYDGGLYMNSWFTARSVGEGTYDKANSKTSSASALESAKTDCLVRCAKDLGVGLQVFSPSYIREWQKKHAVKVRVMEDRKGVQRAADMWRRKDVAPFQNEINPGDKEEPKSEKPWLNHGPDYDTELKRLRECKVTMEELKERWKISSNTWNAIIEVLKKDWAGFVSEKKSMKELTELYNGDMAWINAHKFVLKLFTDRREAIQNQPV